MGGPETWENRDQHFLKSMPHNVNQSVPATINNLAEYSYLYDKYASALYSVILKLNPEIHIANRILEKSFVKIWEELGSFDKSNERLFTLMLRITLQQCKEVHTLPADILPRLLTSRLQAL